MFVNFRAPLRIQAHNAKPSRYQCYFLRIFSSISSLFFGRIGAPIPPHHASTSSKISRRKTQKHRLGSAWAEFVDGDLAAKLYLNASLTPKLTLFDASLKVKVQAQVIGIPVTYRKTFANFKPLIDRDYGNIIPIKPLDLNLFTLGQIMNAMQ